MVAVIVLVATPDDLPLASSVAQALKLRSACRVRVVPATEVTQGDACHAVVTAAPAESLGSLLDSIQHDAVLIHPRPSVAHYKLALRSGIADVIAWPDEMERWQDSYLRMPGPHAASSGAPIREPALEWPESSELMRLLHQRIARVAAFDSNVLLVGETGSGKERVARALHGLSRRRDKPLVTINCAALPEHLVESEMFGYERGAFTGAHSACPGKFALAEGGTLFLDEIGDMPRAAQAKILRVIEGHEYFRLGGARPIHSDVRLIAATHQDLEALCARGDFRADLYFRLNVARIDLPALRERPGDIIPLAEQFLRECCELVRRSRITLSPAVRMALRAYQWPGNVRELHNAVETAFIDAEGRSIELRDLPGKIVRWAEGAAQPAQERLRLESALRRTRWNKSEAARELNWSRMKLYRKLREYSLAQSETAD
jgi:DNA-binding NtrC family response regulator